MTEQTTTETTTTCRSCQAEKTWKTTGKWASEADRAHWMMWGCTCTPEAQADAESWFRRISD